MAIDPDQLTAALLVTLAAFGMAIAFVSADFRAPTSRALALALAATGLSILINHGLIGGLIADVQHPPWWSGWLALPEALAIATMLEWLLRVRRTVPVPPDFDTRAGDAVIRIGQLSGLVYWLLALAWPRLHMTQFLHAIDGWPALGRFGFWLFATPIVVAALAGLASLLLLLNRRPDRGERVRLIAFAVCVPFLCAAFVLQVRAATISVMIGEMVLLVGAVQYHVLQGRRALFLARFMSPEVARLVSERGLRSAVVDRQLTITAVACDLRGFSAYARTVPSDRVIAVLREYYDAVGEVVAEFGGTIKDYAGDGVLVLVGAPIPLADHAARATEMAQRLRTVCGALIGQWRAEDGGALGLGIGLASGPVTVGVIGGAARLEYTAVGSAVNLASRLCEQAGNGEILVDASVAAQVARLAATPRMPLALKGFDAPVAHFAV